MKFVIFGLTVSSSWGNRHADAWRGLAAALSLRGHQISFYEREIPVFTSHRDVGDWKSGELWLYSKWDKIRFRARRDLMDADVAVVTSGCPDAAAATKLVLDSPVQMRIFHDLDSVATLDFEESDLPVAYTPPSTLADFDLVLSATGGAALEELRTLLHARRVAPLYAGVDPSLYESINIRQYRTGATGLSYLADGPADDSLAVDRFLLETARRLPSRNFRIAGKAPQPNFTCGRNVFYEKVVSTAARSAFYRSSRVVLNIAGRANQRLGYCPSESLFQAAACRSPILTENWEGLNLFFEPGTEILVARTTEDAVAASEMYDSDLADIATRARERVLDEHTFAHRARHLETVIENTWNAADEEQLAHTRETHRLEDAAAEPAA